MEGEQSETHVVEPGDTVIVEDAVDEAGDVEITDASMNSATDESVNVNVVVEAPEVEPELEGDGRPAWVDELSGKLDMVLAAQVTTIEVLDEATEEIAAEVVDEADVVEVIEPAPEPAPAAEETSRSGSGRKFGRR